MRGHARHAFFLNHVYMTPRYASLKTSLLLLVLLAATATSFGQTKTKTKTKGRPGKATAAVFDSALYNGLKWRSIGPYRGGRVSRAASSRVPMRIRSAPRA